jgi:anti-anti-sigma factor
MGSLIGFGSPKLHSSTLAASAFSAEVSYGPDRLAVIKVSGDLDMLTAPALQACVARAMESADPVIIDLAAVDFLGSAGLSVLVEARTNAAQAQISCALVTDAATVLRPVELTGLTEILSPYPTLEAALAACQSVQGVH